VGVNEAAISYQWVRKSKLKSTSAGHLEANHIKSHVKILTWIGNSSLWDRISFLVSICEDELADPPSVLGEGEVKISNELVVEADWDCCRVYSFL